MSRAQFRMIVLVAFAMFASWAAVNARAQTAVTESIPNHPALTDRFAFALTNEWAVRMRLDWLSLNYDEYSGDIRSTAIDVLYRPFRNVGFGLGLRNLLLDVEIDDDKWRGRAKTTFTGPAAFVTVSL